MTAKVTKYVSRQLKNLLGNYVDGEIRFLRLKASSPPSPTCSFHREGGSLRGEPF